MYEGTPSQAANGMGNARVRGCKALNKWVEEVSRITRRQAPGDVHSLPDRESGGHAKDEDSESVATPPLPPTSVAAKRRRATKWRTVSMPGSVSQSRNNSDYVQEGYAPV